MRHPLELIAVCAQDRLGGFVQGVGQVRTGKPGRDLGDAAEVDRGIERFLSRMNLEDRLASFDVGRVKNDLAIEPSRAEESMV